jgi:hypothetical protein
MSEGNRFVVEVVGKLREAREVTVSRVCEALGLDEARAGALVARMPGVITKPVGEDRAMKIALRLQEAGVPALHRPLADHEDPFKTNERPGGRASSVAGAADAATAGGAAGAGGLVGDARRRQRRPPSGRRPDRRSAWRGVVRPRRGGARVARLGQRPPVSVGQRRARVAPRRPLRRRHPPRPRARSEADADDGGGLRCGRHRAADERRARDAGAPAPARHLRGGGPHLDAEPAGGPGRDDGASAHGGAHADAALGAPDAGARSAGAGGGGHAGAAPCRRAAPRPCRPAGRRRCRRRAGPSPRRVRAGPRRRSTARRARRPSRR